MVGFALKDGFKLTNGSRQWFIEQINQMDLTIPQRVKMVRWKDKRSIDQNSLYWMWMNEVSEQAKINGKMFEPELWAEIFKKYYCPEKVIELPFGEQQTIKSTTKLDTGEMHHYLNQIEAWCMSQGFMLTIPESSEYKKLIDKSNE